MTSGVRLTDRDIEQLLRARSAGLPEPALLDAILGATRALEQERPRWSQLPTSRRTTILLAAALLTALLVGISVAVGSGILRLPWPADREPDMLLPLAGPITNCHRPLAEDVALTVVDWQEESQFTVYADGLVIEGPPVGWGAREEIGLEGTWRQRRLSSDGVERLIASVSSGLSDCRQYASDRFVEIQAKTDQGPYAIRIGQDVLETRVTTPAEAAAADALVERLATPDLGLGAAEWLDPDWDHHLPTRWRVWVEFSPRGPDGPRDAAPSADELTLPDGSSLSTFGQEAAPDPGSATGARCSIVSTPEARAIADAIDSLPGEAALASGATWQLDLPERAAIAIVTIAALLPHERSCVSDLQTTASPTPAPAPSIPSDQRSPLPSACPYVTRAVVSEVVGRVGGDVEDYPGWSEDWSFCWYPVDPSGLAIASSRRPVERERAEQLARDLFGDAGFVVEQLDGGSIFLNGCARPGADCRAVVAISLEPHFVVVSWQPASEGTLRALAEAVLEQLVSSP